MIASVREPIEDFRTIWAGIGNSVPPFMARAAGERVRRTILESEAD